MAIEVVAATRGAENRGGAVKGDVDAGLGQPLQIACDGIPNNEVDAVEAHVMEDSPMRQLSARHLAQSNGGWEMGDADVVETKRNDWTRLAVIELRRKPSSGGIRWNSR